jgi:hypothetical protein
VYCRDFYFALSVLPLFTALLQIRRTLLIQETVLDVTAFAALVGLYVWSIYFVRALG